MSRLDRRPVSPISLNAEPLKGFGVSTSILLLLLFLYAATRPQLDIVGVRVASIHPVETVTPKRSVTTVTIPQQRGSSGEQGARRATAQPEVPSTTPPQTMTMIIPTPTDGAVTPLADGALEWGRSDGIERWGDPNGRSRYGGSTDGDPSGTSASDDEVLEFAEVEPEIDMDALRNAIRYPEIARRNGIEGSVIVKALVGRDGVVRRAEVFDSDNELLDNAAIEGVRKAVFTPGKQNGHAVSCWIYVPVNFRLSSR